MKKVKFKDVKDGQEFAFDEISMISKETRRVKGQTTFIANNRWADGDPSAVANIGPDQEVYVDQPDEPELPELGKGLYIMMKNNTSCWMFGIYDGVEGNRYRFLQAKESGTFTVNPKKWYIRQFLLK